MTRSDGKKKAKAKRPEVTEKIQSEVANNPKRPIKFNVELNEEQKEAKRLILGHQITLITGGAGSGKTLVGVQTLLDMYFKKEIKKIWITRPNVQIEDYGFLPGTLEDKMDPLLVPIYDNLYKCYNEEAINKLAENKIIDIAPIAYIRGRTIDDAGLIIDETQNIDEAMAEALLTRLGKQGKIVITGDAAQIDLKNKMYSGINSIAELVINDPDMAYIELKENHRSPLVLRVIEFYKKRREAQALKNEDKQKKMLKD